MQREFEKTRRLILRGGLAAGAGALGAPIAAQAQTQVAANPAYEAGPLLKVRDGTIPSPIASIRTSGFSRDGDGGDGLYVAVDRPSRYPGSGFSDRGGRHWQYVPDARGVNAKAFGAVDDARVDAQGRFIGSNSAPMIQAAIDFAAYAAKTVVYLPARDTGCYLVADTLQLGYGDGFRSVVIEGDGSKYRGEPSFAGTAILANFSDRPAVAVSGARQSVVRRMSILGVNAAWIARNRLMSRAPLVDDTVLSNWLDPALGPGANGRYTPYAAIAIDPYSGPRPPQSYPDVTFPSWSGIKAQYGKAFSSGVQLEDLYVAGFVAVVAIQPSDADGNGDFVKLIKVRAEKNVYVITAGNTQGRACSTIDCSFSEFHSGVVNAVHGRQKGQLQLHSVSTDWEQAIQILDIPLATYAGPFLFEGGYSESLWRIGRWGGAASDNPSLTFDSCVFHFTAQDDARGRPLEVLSAGPPAQVAFRGCVFNTFQGVLGFGRGADAAGFTFEHCVSRPSSEEPQPYRRFAMNFLGGGLMFNPLRGSGRPARYSVAARPYNLDSGRAEANTVEPAPTTDQAHPLCAWRPQARPATRPELTVAVPRLWTALPPGAVISAGMTGATLRLVLRRPDALLANEGPLPGDVLWDDHSGLVFFAKRWDRDQLTLWAELQNGFRLAGRGSGDQGSAAPVELAPDVAFDAATARFVVGNARLFASPDAASRDTREAGAPVTDGIRFVVRPPAPNA